MPKRARIETTEENLEQARTYVEALLFSSERPVDSKTLMRSGGLRSESSLERVIDSLNEEYSRTNRAFTISRLPGKKYLMHLRPSLVGHVRRHLVRPSFGTAVMRTLSFIAYHQPVQRSTVAAVRGSRAYSHIRTLIERGLVMVEDRGKSVVLRTTPLLAELLNVNDSPSEIKRKIEELMDATSPREGREQQGSNQSESRGLGAETAG
ncbi:MAG: SMC-Scp complex subunit ScpB [Aigarchaeota archaeon]|nr:SMC-Scp complex subunit ScpB [Aigarchaeota archaeon]MDW8093007.1 SMC-Scp complex subunit ScpB [Nitrososphaerota archaeon]